MAEPAKNLEREALSLAENERADLARVFLLSLGDWHDQATELEWAEEAERRYEEIRAGSVQAVPSHRVFEEARARLK
jgi:hypothetical protein